MRAGLVGVSVGRSGIFHHAVKAAQHGERQDHLAVFVALVGASEDVADSPDEFSEFLVGSCVHKRSILGMVSEDRGLSALRYRRALSF